MKTLFIPVKSKAKLNKKTINEISKKLPKKIVICYSIQFKKQAEEIKEKIKDKNVLKLIQVLGCSNPILPKNTQAILLIGQGKFHSVSLQYETGIPVYLIENNKLILVSEKDIENLKRKEKTAYLKFLHSEEVGIIVTTKPGQQKLNKALELKKKLKKKSYLFLSNNINIREFENFGLNSWINTACPRMDLDDTRIINIKKLEENDYLKI